MARRFQDQEMLMWRGISLLYTSTGNGYSTICVAAGDTLHITLRGQYRWSLCI